MIDVSKGRIISSHGYVKLLMPKHPEADSKGYVYEHRIVAEKKIGRKLLHGEQIHHLDGIKTNNDPDNLDITKSIAHHAVKHRKRTDLRMPGEENPIIKCKCGCGSTFTKYDDTGRPREFISGHNSIDLKPLCKCGCGQKTIYNNRPYLPYHWTKKHQNIEVYCACGCETLLKKYDAHGRERKYVSGHNGRKL